jgi:hypothetical protein
MAPRDEKAQSVHWDNPAGSNEERSSFKKKKKFVYLEKYESTVQEINEDIVSLHKAVVKLWIAIAGLVVALVLTTI